jgi:hypothetical protein
MAASSILLYLLKANAALLLFAAAYFGLLRRLTFFTLNRGYLLAALLFAAVYPALPVPALLPARATPAVVFVVTEVVGAHSTALAPDPDPVVDWVAVGLALYAAGTAVLLLRLLGQLLALGRLRRQARPAVVQGQPVRVLAGSVSPFSFWQSIYLNPDQHPGTELTAVLRHEQVHVRQWHTLDVLLAQLALAAAWCNPAAWLLRRALLDNLEYLADQAVLETGVVGRRAYQLSLLRLSHGAGGLALVSHFTFPTLKNRVLMMNKPLSSTGQLARYVVAGPLVLALALGLAGARAQGAGPVMPAAAPAISTTHAQAEPTPATSSNTKPIIPLRQSRPAKAIAAPATAGVTIRPATAAPAPAARIVLDGPRPSGPPPLYYVDGKLNGDAIKTTNPNDIASINVFKGEQARQLAGDAGLTGIVVITTKQNQYTPEVRAFNEKMGLATVPPAPAAGGSVPYLAAPALAYITQHYPGARLLGVSEVPAADGARHYQAEVALGRRPGYLLFDGQGQFISESYNSYLK